MDLSNKQLFIDGLLVDFQNHFGEKPDVISYAPGRVEVLGNHTDYNEGYVLSAAIDKGTFFLVKKNSTGKVKIVAKNVGDEITFDISSIIQESRNGIPIISKDQVWSNYVKGVLVGIATKIEEKQIFGFDALFAGDLPLGLGLSSSAALEISSGLAIETLYGINITKHELAKIGQKSEHVYVGVKCGLLDQISSIFGKKSHLVLTDFRTLEVENVPLGENVCFLICNTKVSHELVSSEYNERRESCEKAAAYFAKHLSHPVTHLRDVSWEELKNHSSNMEKRIAMRASHIIGENTRVLKGKELLSQGKLSEFGKLMFESHESSSTSFENSCKELDVIVNCAKRIPQVYGARLSGGGFGGAALVAVDAKDKEFVQLKLEELYHKETGKNIEISSILPSDGALLL